MKKSLLILPLLMVGSSVFAQCNIIGKANVGINETAEYSVDMEGQCADCYQWKTINNQSVIMGSGTQKKVGVKGTGNGQTLLSVTVLTPQGVSMCSKTIGVGDVNNAPNNNRETEPNCDVDVREFKETKISEGLMAFFPSATNNVYNYQWTATYANGETKTSNEKVPQLQYPMQTIKLRVTSKKCYKEYTKTYTDSFWRFF